MARKKHPLRTLCETGEDERVHIDWFSNKTTNAEEFLFIQKQREQFCDTTLDIEFRCNPDLLRMFLLFCALAFETGDAP